MSILIDKDTRVILVFPKGHFCSRGQRLDASFEINTQNKIENYLRKALVVKVFIYIKK